MVAHIAGELIDVLLHVVQLRLHLLLQRLQTHTHVNLL